MTNKRSAILEGLNINRINEAAVKPELKSMMDAASMIGHEWWRYLDEKYFGIKSNYYFRVGHKTTGSEVERMCGRYVCGAGFNAHGYSSSKGFLVGFNLSKGDSNEMEAEIYRYEQEIEHYDGGAVAVLKKSGIKNTGESIKFPISEVDSQYVKYAKVLAQMVNNLAKKEPKSE